MCTLQQFKTNETTLSAAHTQGFIGSNPGMTANAKQTPQSLFYYYKEVRD